MSRYIIVLFIFMLAACSREVIENPQWVKPQSITLTCEAYSTATISLGVLTNNVWNKGAAAGENWSQCLEKRLIDGEYQFGWSWSWPMGRKVIYSQPQIKVGSSPWSPEPKFDSAFPLKINDLRTLNISHDLDISSNGEHNTAITMWLISEKYTGSQPNKAVIAAEIMLWTHATAGHLNPAGRKLNEITIGDQVWEVWYQQDWEDKSGVNDNKWVYISFRAKHSAMTFNIPALELLHYAIQQDLISDQLYIADVELGNEIMSGAGITWVKAFNVDYVYKVE